MKFIKRIFLFISLFALYIIAREFLELYVLMRSVHPIAGYATLIIIMAAIIYFVAIPVIKILRIPIYKGPTKDKDKEIEIIRQRNERFKKNEVVKKLDIDFSIESDERKIYKDIIRELNLECQKIRSRYVSQLFYTSSISQNGFIDAILILSSSISLVKEIFLLYNGRVSNRDLLAIGQKIYYSMAIGGSEGVEYATDELISRFASESIKSIPFIDKILGSLADGFVNAVLLTRISYITENYCKLTYIQSDRDIYPSPKFIVGATRSITANITDRITNTLRKMTVDKSINFALVAANPIGFVLSKTIDKMTEDSDKIDPKVKYNLKEGVMLVGNPISYGLGKLLASLRKK